MDFVWKYIVFRCVENWYRSDIGFVRIFIGKNYDENPTKIWCWIDIVCVLGLLSILPNKYVQTLKSLPSPLSFYIHRYLSWPETNPLFLLNSNELIHIQFFFFFSIQSQISLRHDACFKNLLAVWMSLLLSLVINVIFSPFIHHRCHSKSHIMVVVNGFFACFECGRPCMGHVHTLTYNKIINVSITGVGYCTIMLM